GGCEGQELLLPRQGRGQGDEAEEAAQHAEQRRVLRRDGLHRRRRPAAPRHGRGDERPAAGRVRAGGARPDEPRRAAAAHARAGAQRHGPACPRQRQARPIDETPRRNASRKVIQAPPWLIRFLTPLISRYLARELSAKHPGLGPEEIVAMMRADLRNPPTEDEQRLLDAVRARLPEK